ncbi:MAG TPA: aconitase family protein, partial [Gammaproteobacteria bacterium]|nr:aconitase family protein [Gammaproteobacteria bacterium]
MSLNSFNSRSTFEHAEKTVTFYDLNKLPKSCDIGRLPYCLKILLENLLRCEDGISVTQKDIEALLNWAPHTPSDHEIAFTPARVILQDFTGVPAVVDLAAMRDAMCQLGGKASLI